MGIKADLITYIFIIVLLLLLFTIAKKLCQIKEQKKKKEKKDKNEIVLVQPYILHLLVYPLLFFAIIVLFMSWGDETNYGIVLVVMTIAFAFFLEFPYRRFRMTVKDDVLDIRFVWKRRCTYSLDEVTRVVDDIINRLVLYKGDKVIIKLRMELEGYHELYKYLESKGYKIEREE